MRPPGPRRCELRDNALCPAECNPWHHPCTDEPSDLADGPPMWIPLSIVVLALVIGIAVGMWTCRI